MIREIVTIDEELCDGCGLCVPACAEGAIRMVNGKARLVAERMCDGMGACLGHCPHGAINIELREADEFDEQAIAGRTTPAQAKPAPATDCPDVAHAHGPATPPPQCACPGAQLKVFSRTHEAAVPATAQSSELTHWPVQLRLLPPYARVLKGASLLVAADCVPVACAEFHGRFLHGRAVVIGCPKFDDLEDYVCRMEEMIRSNDLTDITVARMEVPCCAGILRTVLEARRRAAVDVPVNDVVIGTNGDVLSEERVVTNVTSSRHD
ncbi:MAG: 4Fe-4S binding protein [Phycisphaerae bacterium]|nr:4Fe-4S binding protein [Phycisphaerae bacterium]